MIVLGIESSCDETATAVVDDKANVLSSQIFSQIPLHQKFGGIIPEIAARSHLEKISVLTESALSEAGIGLDKVDAIAVTQGPGLVGSLLVGISYASGLALSLNKPLIPVNHVHAHIYGALLGLQKQPEWPMIAMVVSGGHTNLYYMKNSLNFQLIGYSLDDACGESFDKVAKMLDLGYPGGPIIEKMAQSGDCEKYSMPVSKLANFRFSYSGIKTHVLNKIAKIDNLDSEKKHVCAGFQKAAIDQLLHHFKKAAKKYPECQSLIIAGGVAANSYLRDQLIEQTPFACHFPELKYCGDNAAMIAYLGLREYEQSPQQGFTTEPFARYPFEEYIRNDL